MKVIADIHPRYNWRITCLAVLVSRRSVFSSRLVFSICISMLHCILCFVLKLFYSTAVCCFMLKFPGWWIVTGYNSGYCSQNVLFPSLITVLSKLFDGLQVFNTNPYLLLIGNTNWVNIFRIGPWKGGDNVLQRQSCFKIWNIKY